MGLSGPVPLWFFRKEGSLSSLVSRPFAKKKGPGDDLIRQRQEDEGIYVLKDLTSSKLFFQSCSRISLDYLASGWYSSTKVRLPSPLIVFLYHVFVRWAQGGNERSLLIFSIICHKEPNYDMHSTVVLTHTPTHLHTPNTVIFLMHAPRVNSSEAHRTLLDIINSKT